MADTTAWCVANRNGNLITSTLAPTRRASIYRMCDDYKAWRWWKRQGARCVRVRLLAAPAGGEG